MDKTKFIARLALAWGDFNDSFAGLSEERMLQPGVTGDWSVRDILAHVSWWEEETLKHLPEILQGIRLQRYSVLYGGIDAFNALKTEAWRSFTLAEVRARLEATHRRLIEYLQSVPEEHFSSGGRFLRRLRLDTSSHYPIHARLIREWRERTA